MSKPEKNSKPGFVIKLSCETVQKISEEEQKAKSLEEPTKLPVPKVDTPTIVPKSSKALTECEQASTLDLNKSADIQNKEKKQQEADQKSDTKCVEDKQNTKDPKAVTDWGDYAAYVTYENENAVYTDPSTQQKYLWNKETNSWDPNKDVPNRVYSFENDTHVYTEADGSKFFWDDEKKAWIPKVDDEFLAYYQMSYGFVDNTKDEKKEEANKQVNQKKLEPGVKRKTEPQWFEQSEDKNTKVYVSNLPLDLTEEEFVNFMQKCGLIERDPSTQKMKVKLYMDKEHNCFKGDALCTYIKIESVELALKFLDGCDFKGKKVNVERAQFQLKGEYNPALKPKKKKKKEIEKIKKIQQKLFDWRPEKFIGERSKHERIVIVKNLFQPTDFDKDVQLILDYQQDLREESAKCGQVRKVVIYDRHPDGVAQITMSEPEEADEVVKLINGRWFGKRQITAETWDGRTKYRIAETDAEINERINNWDMFLEGKDGGVNQKVVTTAGADVGRPSEEVVEKQTEDNSSSKPAVVMDSNINT
ncbi:unnamed protein product, partial [Iphiclides podalirius]